MWVQSNNPDADYPDNEGLAAIIAAFGFGSNFTLATPVMNTLFKNTGINPNDVGTVTFSPEPVISPTVATTQSE